MSSVFTKKVWYLRVTMSPKDFEEHYNCKDGLLKKELYIQTVQAGREIKA